MGLVEVNAVGVGVLDASGRLSERSFETGRLVLGGHLVSGSYIFEDEVLVGALGLEEGAAQVLSELFDVQPGRRVLSERAALHYYLTNHSNSF